MSASAERRSFLDASMLRHSYSQCSSTRGASWYREHTDATVCNLQCVMRWQSLWCEQNHLLLICWVADHLYWGQWVIQSDRTISTWKNNTNWRQWPGPPNFQMLLPLMATNTNLQLPMVRFDLPTSYTTDVTIRLLQHAASRSTNSS